MSAEFGLSPERVFHQHQGVAAAPPSNAFEARWTEWKARGVQRDRATRRKSAVALLVLTIVAASSAVMWFLHGAA
jgi:hypothetical protein